MRRVVAACVLALALPAAAQAMTDKVSIGQVLSLAQAPYYVALEKGYFAKEGIELDSGDFRGAQDMTSALATGQLDIGIGAFNAGFFNAAQKGLDLRAVAALGAQPRPVLATPPLVRKDLWDSGAIRSGKDLKGRKVAVNTPGSTPEFTLSLILEKYGMTLKDVDETMLGFPQMVIALQNKAIDMGFVPAPLHAIALREKTAVLLAPDAGVGAGELTVAVFFSGNFLRTRPEVGERFLRALALGARETQGAYNRKPEAAALLAKATGIKIEDIEDSIVYTFDPRLDIDKFRGSIRRQEAQHGKDGRLDYSPPVPIDRVIDTAPLKKALADLR